MNDTITTPTLTADDLAAIRMARSVAFHYHEGEFYMRAHLETGYGKPAVFTAKQQLLFPDIWSGNDWRARKMEVSQQYSGITNYSAEYTSDKSAVVSAYASGHSYDPTWDTVKSLLKVGDIIGIRFIADNNNETIKRADLHADEMHLIVVRGGKRLTFHIDNVICPNNTARMVRFI